MDSDLKALDVYRESFARAYESVLQRLGDLHLEPGGRIKTTLSIVDKLKR